MAIYSEFSHKKMVIFHSYVSLPEGRFPSRSGFTPWENGGPKKNDKTA